MADPKTIPQALDAAAHRWPDGEALVDGDRRWTWTGLATEVDDAAAGLIGWGIEPGDRVAIWGPNIWEWVIASLAVHRVGGVVVTLNTRFKGHEGRHNIERSGARLLLCATDFLDTDYSALLAEAGAPDCLEGQASLRGPAPSGGLTWAQLVDLGGEVAPETVSARAAAVGPDDASDVLFTSGTTGSPKGAVLRHGASVRAFSSWASVVGLRHDDRYLIINPFFHAFGLKAGILASILTGATMVPHPIFDVPSVMARIGEERISMLPGPPAIYETMLNHPALADLDTSSLRLAVTGAAPVPVSLIDKMRSVLGFETIVTGYGLTEAHGIVTMNRHDDPPEIISATDGRAIDGVEVVLFDGDDEVPVGQPGEIRVRGYNLMAGYIGDDAATAEAIDADGWLRTGDIGVMDEAGNLKITDRLKDMFIVGGFNAYPAEIEKALVEHPTVAQAAVVGIPDARMGEVGCAFVVPAADAHLEEAELIEWARERMANFKVPRHVVAIDALPMNASNKVLKHELRAKAAAELSG